MGTLRVRSRREAIQDPPLAQLGPSPVHHQEELDREQDAPVELGRLEQLMPRQCLSYCSPFPLTTEEMGGQAGFPLAQGHTVLK